MLDYSTMTGSAPTAQNAKDKRLFEGVDFTQAIQAEPAAPAAVVAEESDAAVDAAETGATNPPPCVAVATPRRGRYAAIVTVLGLGVVLAYLYFPR